MGVGGVGLIGPAMDHRVRDVVGIEADVQILAVQPLAFQPGQYQGVLGIAVAIAADDAAEHAPLPVPFLLGADDVVEA